MKSFKVDDEVILIKDYTHINSILYKSAIGKVVSVNKDDKSLFADFGDGERRYFTNDCVSYINNVDELIENLNKLELKWKKKN